MQADIAAWPLMPVKSSAAEPRPQPMKAILEASTIRAVAATAVLQRSASRWERAPEVDAATMNRAKLGNNHLLLPNADSQIQAFDMRVHGGGHSRIDEPAGRG